MAVDDAPTLRFEGMREFRAQLRAMGDDLADLKDTHRAAAEVVAPTARRLSPIITGELRDTVRTGASKTRALVRAGYARTPYAGPIHFGWPARNIAPQPFIYAAMDRRRSEVITVYADRVAEIARRNGLNVRRAAL